MQTQHLFKKTLLAASAAALFAGCGTSAEQAPEMPADEAAQTTQEQGLLPACDPVELEEVAEHACIHAELGPFEPVTAAANGAPVLVDVSLPHTAYNITLPAAKYFGYSGRVAFIPEESGEFAFLLSRYRGLRIFEAATGTEVARECRYNVPGDVCGVLKTGLVADLEAGVEYHLQFQAIAPRNSQFTLLIEEAGHHHEE
ncbi:hypothetical protein HPC49_29230 [Pyxidicoccus fallax]|uniref:Lipoprotein n=1 Tax=Pyxidicoccus fallax TaxID=394095 RepID=A0A848LJD8_9BACT|nr:hypothetical protein [Pyxidicoccus fallax]NMO17832.1 hypothetical protein [Pyxidicoccus fallax]NPC82289.1 hypothetical protein [Pyxidicoccus fallax]